jgi:hypothetical protein
MNRGQKVFGFGFLLLLIGTVVWLWLAFQQPEMNAVDTSLLKAALEQGTLVGAQNAAQATLESARAGVATLQVDVATVKAIGVELETIEAHMATDVAVGAVQATRINGIVRELHPPTQPESMFTFGTRELYVVVALAVLVALGFLVATFWRQSIESEQEAEPRSVNPETVTRTTSTTPLSMKRRDGSNNPGK